MDLLMTAIGLVDSLRLSLGSREALTEATLELELNLPENR